jgi:hypothetical protein
MCPLAMFFEAKSPAKVTRDSHYCTSLGHLGRHSTERIISILCCTTLGGQGKYSSDCHLLLSPIVLLTNFANVNDPLMRETIEMKGITKCKLTIISQSAVCKKFLVQIWSYAASL